MKPSWSRRDKSILLSYELPHRIHTAKSYPITAPNGSSIIIYGHQNGLRFIWRGGRKYKHKAKPESAVKSNGTERDEAIRIDDSDEEELFEQQDLGLRNGDESFDSEEDESEPTEPYDHIIAQRDVSLGTGVLHIALPPLLPNTRRRSTKSTPPIFGQQVVVAAACADCAVRLVTTPVNPSANQKFSEQEQSLSTILTVTSAHHSVPRGLSLTWTSPHYSPFDDYDESDDGESSGERSRDQSSKWSLLVASHSVDAGGLLVVSSVPIIADGERYRLSEHHTKPIQTQYLTSPAISVAFNPACFPSSRHTQMLLADSSGLVRVYDPLPLNKYQPDLLTPYRQEAWLTSLYSPFQDAKYTPPDEVTVSQRSRILDAQWALNGKCVVVLLADGQWGLWDIGGIGPGMVKGHVQGDNNAYVGAGLGVTPFALQGYVGDSATTSLNGDSTGSSGNSKEISRLAPLTPKTRKVKQQAFFTGETSTSSTPGLVRGGLSLSATSNFMDESLLMWFRSALYAIPSLMSYWQRVAKSASKSGAVSDASTLHGPSITKLRSLTTFGEQITSISLIPLIGRPVLTGPQSLQHDVMVSAEHRIVMLCPLRLERQSTDEVARLFHRSKKDLEEQAVRRVDQALLAKRELDIGGVERLLDGMSNGDSKMLDEHRPLGVTNQGRKVGFATEN